MMIAFLGPLELNHVQRWADFFHKKGWNVLGIDYKDCETWKFKKIKLPITNKKLFFINWLSLKKILNENKPDILVAFYATTYGFLGSLASYKPFVIITLGSDILLNPRNFLLGSTVRYCLGKADLVSVDAEFAEKVIMNLGVDKKKIFLRYDGVYDLKRFSKKISGENVRKKLGWKSNFVIGSFRNLRGVYSIDTFVKSIPLIIKNLPEARFLIVGDGPLRGRLTNLVEELGVEKYVKFAGYVKHENMQEYMKACDVFVSTSLSDTTSVTLLEAMACGLPCVVTGIEGNREWIKEGVNGYLFDCKNSEELTEKVLTLHKRDAKEMKKIGESNSRLVKKKCDWEVNMKRVDKLFRVVVMKQRSTK
jgi:glycosyltransferase involved in cell wall biosynthesis